MLFGLKAIILALFEYIVFNYAVTFHRLRIFAVDHTLILEEIRVGGHIRYVFEALSLGGETDCVCKNFSDVSPYWI